MTNKVKIVKLNDSPNVGTGISLVGGGSGAAQDIVLSDLGISLATASGLQADPSTSYSSAGLYHYNGALMPDSAATPVAFFQPFSPDFTSQTIAAANYTLSGIEILSFYLPFASWSPTSAALGNVWLIWVSNGAYPIVINTPPSVPEFTAKEPIAPRALVLSRRTCHPINVFIS